MGALLIDLAQRDDAQAVFSVLDIDDRAVKVAQAFADLPVAQQKQLLEITPVLTEIMRRRAAERPDGGDPS